MILHKSFDINEAGNLTIAGVDAVELAAEFGTPAYIIDEDSVREKCRIYKTALAEHFSTSSIPVYANKALSCKEMYRIAASEGLGVDCVSPGELYTAASVDFPMERVYFHGNNKTDNDIEMGVNLGVGYIVCDSHEELDAIDRIAASNHRKQTILLRITPGIDPHTHQKIVTGNVDSKFGSAIVTGQAFDIVKHALSLKNVTLAGLHCHIGSLIFDMDPFTDAADIMLRFIAQLKNELGWEAQELNLGGGFAVRYTEFDPQIDYADNIKVLADKVNAVCAELSITRPAIRLEPGRSIVAASGATLYTVGSVKEIPGFRNYVSVDGGMPDNPRYALYQSQYTMLTANKANEEKNYECTVAGRCCESGDLLGEGVSLQKPERGDILAVLVTGAYNYSMASNYNRLPRPPIVMISDKKPRIVVKRETYEDILRCDV